jgi:hypothetical protein
MEDGADKRERGEERGEKRGGRREDRLMNIYETFSGVKERSNHRRALY